MLQFSFVAEHIGLDAEIRERMKPKIITLSSCYLNSLHIFRYYIPSESLLIKILIFISYINPLF